jgi:hypothetical protein
VSTTGPGFDRFVATYREQLAIAHEKFPEEYVWPAREIPFVAIRMENAIREGTFNKDGRAFKATCKLLGIKHTYTAIRAYIEEGPTT